MNWRKSDEIPKVRLIEAIHVMNGKMTELGLPIQVYYLNKCFVDLNCCV